MTDLPEPLSIMGVEVTPFESYSQATAYVAEAISAGRKTFFVAINPEKVFRAGRDSHLREVLKTADAGICDGIGIVLGAKVLYGRRITRVTGCDLFLRLTVEAAERGWRLFLLGASDESNRLAAAKLKERSPALRIVGRCDGFFQDSGEVIRRINSSGADIVFAAMGSPAQEFWLAEHRRRIDAAFCMGVGGSFDVLSGKASRAPALFRRTGTEFLFRLVTQPKRLRRQLALPAFMIRLVQAKLLGSHV